MKIKLKMKEKEYDVEIIDSEKSDSVKIIVNAKEFLFNKDNSDKEITVAQTIIPKRDFSAKVIKASIAGVISEVSVGVGDLVKPGQKLLILSAMKMENEIVSDIEGKIKEIKIKQNGRVKEGDVLIILT